MVTFPVQAKTAIRREVPEARGCGAFTEPRQAPGRFMPAAAGVTRQLVHTINENTAGLGTPRDRTRTLYRLGRIPF